MGVAHWPFGYFPPGHWPPWHFSGQGGYQLYRGEGREPADVDFSEPVGCAQAGQTDAYAFAAALAAETEYVYALRAVSDAGIEDQNVTCYCRARIDGEGSLIGERPNMVLSASRRRAAGGKLAVAFTYSRLGEKAEAATVQIARATGDAIDWESPLATVALAAGKATRHDGKLAETFDDGETVRLALRAVTAGGVAGPVLRLPAIAADASAPAPLGRLELEQL